VNISGWYLSDAKHFLKKYRIPDGTNQSAAITCVVWAGMDRRNVILAQP